MNEKIIYFSKLEFNIFLPKDWVIKKLSWERNMTNLNRRFLGDIVLAESPILNAAKAIFSVQFISLDREISAQNWLKNYAHASNYYIEGEVESFGNKQANAYLVYMLNGQTVHSYATLHINRNVAVMVQIKLPESLRESMNFLQKEIINSFRLVMPTDDSVEKQEFFSFNDAMRFGYPESWKIYYPNLKDANNMSAQIHNMTKAGKIEGLIRFIVVRRVSDTDLKTEVEKLKKYFDEFFQLDIKELRLSKTAPVYDRFIFSRYEVYRVLPRKKMNRVKELRFVILGDKEWYILMFLLAPSEEDDLSSWSRDIQTFDLILKSIR